MRKYSSAIFLSLLIMLAFANAGFLAVPVIDAASSVNKTEQATGIRASIHYPESDIEYANSRGSNVFNSHYAVQKTPVYYPAAGNTRMPVITAVLYAPTVFEKELFDNNYLSYNYPSHNFW